MKESITLDEVVIFLNELIKIDPNAMKALMEQRVPCNKEMADHPTVQVDGSEKDKYRVGFLGVLNGLFGVDEKNCGFLAFIFDDESKKLIEARKINIPRTVVNK